MYTTSDEKGILNNFAKEPKISYAEYPSPQKRRGYFLQGAIAALLVSGVVAIAFAVS